ncbi:MAG: zinc ribbon domain-containing protein [Anaerolineales bacterium]
MSQVRQLVQLQDLDTQLDQAKKRLVEIDAALNDNSAVKKAAARSEKAAGVLMKARLALKNAELDVQTQQDKIDRNQKALYGGGNKSPKELEDLQMESEALARYLGVLEDRQLEAMMAFEEADSASQTADKALTDTKNQAAAGNVDLTAEQEDLLAKVAGLEAEREALAAPIEPDLLSEYEKLRQTRMGVAVSEIRDGGCSVCGANLSAAQIQAARSPSKTATCEVCGRILYA